MREQAAPPTGGLQSSVNVAQLRACREELLGEGSVPDGGVIRRRLDIRDAPVSAAAHRAVASPDAALQCGGRLTGTLEATQAGGVRRAPTTGSGSSWEWR